MYKLSTSSTDIIEPHSETLRYVSFGEKLKLYTIYANPFSVAKALADRSTTINYFALIKPSVISLAIVTFLIDPLKPRYSKYLQLVINELKALAAFV